MIEASYPHRFSGENVYVAIDGKEVGSLRTAVEILTSRRISRWDDLVDYAIQIWLDIPLDSPSFERVMALKRNEVYHLTLGPKGSDPGMPKHAQKCILTNQPTVEDERKGRAFICLNLIQSEGPEVSLFFGGVFE